MTVAERRHRFTVDILDDDARPLERIVLEPDWARALEWARFEGIREGRLPAVMAAASGVVEPVWDGRAGEPVVAAFRTVVRGEDGTEVAREIPKAYVRGLVQQAAAVLVERGTLSAGDTYRWVVRAFPAPEPEAPRAGGFAVEELVQPLPLAEGSLGGFLARSLLDGPAEPAEVVPVFLPRRVLDEAVAGARQAGELETGGVLVGRLRRDAAARPAALFVEITAQVPAPHTRAESTRLTFTAETWAAVQAAITLRRQGELMLGWWHSHPDFCRLRHCPEERRATCPGASPFFSPEDVHLHATCFPSAYHVALLVSAGAPDGMTCSLFGWSHGMVTARGFHVLSDVPTTEGDSNATPVAPGF